MISNQQVTTASNLFLPSYFFCSWTKQLKLSYNKSRELSENIPLLYNELKNELEVLLCSQICLHS